MTQKTSWVRAFAVIRVDSETPRDTSSNCELGPDGVTVKEVVLSETDAIAEVARLNDLNATTGCKYYWQGTHLFNRGGSHGSELLASADAARTPTEKQTLAAAGNTMAPAWLLLRHKGYEVVRETRGGSDTWKAMSQGVELVAEDPLSLLGLAQLHEAHREEWRATDSHTSEFLATFELE